VEEGEEESNAAREEGKRMRAAIMEVVETCKMMTYALA